MADNVTLFGQQMVRCRMERPVESVSFLWSDPPDMFARVSQHLDQYPRLTLQEAVAAVRKQVENDKKCSMC